MSATGRPGTLWMAMNINRNAGMAGKRASQGGRSRVGPAWAAFTAVVVTAGLAVVGGGSAYATTPADVTDVPGTLTDQYNTTGVEGADKFVDNTPYTKYFTLHPTTWLQYVAQEPATVTGYSITSANDAPDRDPRNWVLEASTNGTTWLPLDTPRGCPVLLGNAMVATAAPATAKMVSR